jgi:GNAT superfamily N-acetyltransferase
MPTITLREAYPDDADGIARVHRETWRTTYQGILPAAVVEHRGANRYPLFWAHALEERRLRVLLAETDDGEVVAFVAFGAPREPAVSFDVEVYSLYVLQRFQRHGIGRALFAEVARRSIREGQFSVYLWVIKANPARLFYEVLGGEFVTQRTETIVGHDCVQVAYGWTDLSRFINPKRARRAIN